MPDRRYRWHCEKSGLVPASAEAVFAHIDDQTRLSSHMSKSSWMMGGGKMDLSTDAGGGRKIGSHIRLAGRVFGIRLFLDEVVVEREPARRKTWETVGNPRLLVIGHYRMGFDIGHEGGQSSLRVFIDYDPPAAMTWLGTLFGGLYARWCVATMLRDAVGYFTAPAVMPAMK